MQHILKGLRVVEGSAFIAAPSGGMTLAQLGADVIRFDQIGGGIDYHRWPVTENGKSLYWHSLNKGKRSIAVNFRNEAGRELIKNLIAAPGEDNGFLKVAGALVPVPPSPPCGFPEPPAPPDPPPPAPL